MTPQQFADLLEYIKANNSWHKMIEVIKRNRRVVKYVDATFDTRDGTIWHIKFRQGGLDEGFRIERHEDIQAIYKWLDEKIDYKG